MAAAMLASERALDWACTAWAVSCRVWVIFWNSFSNGRAKAVAVLASTPTIEPTTSIASWKSFRSLARTVSWPWSSLGSRGAQVVQFLGHPIDVGGEVLEALGHLGAVPGGLTRDQHVHLAVVRGDPLLERAVAQARDHVLFGDALQRSGLLLLRDEADPRDHQQGDQGKQGREAHFHNQRQVRQALHQSLPPNPRSRIRRRARSSKMNKES
ncbi:MAG: hypothetical protein WDN45_13395 [Caulobacteraceae bacterium]